MKKPKQEKPAQELQSVWFEGYEIRSFLEDSQDCWLVARDVFKALGTPWNGRRDLVNIPTENTLRRNFATQTLVKGKIRSQSRNLVFVNEAAFHVIAIRSNHPKTWELINQIGQFIKDCRLGRVTQTQIDMLQREAQQLFGFFVPSVAQRPRNHVRNQKAKLLGIPIDRYWDDAHVILSDKPCKDRRPELVQRGASEAMVKRSVLDGLRCFEDTYWETIPHAIRSDLTLKGYGVEQVNKVLKDGKDFFKSFGNLIASKECTKPNTGQQDLEL